MNCANHPERERFAFCQNCGKPLCRECSRTVGAGVFCEPCLAARLTEADAAAGYSAVPGAAGMPEAVGMPSAAGPSNPALAALLGFIPGVGAMYNGQYAKGVVHLIVFAVLVSLADSVGVFGVFVAGWVFYMAIEAYHTAKARREGTPLPNPFGLNDVGERFGFGRSWTGPVAAPAAAPAPAADTGYKPPVGTQFTQAADGSQSFVGGDGTYFRQGADGSQSYGGPGTYGSSWGAPSESYAHPVPPFVGVQASAYPQVPLAVPQSRFPVGAVWLIGLGLLFFFGSSGLFRHFPIQRLLPFFLIGLGVWIFVRKMTGSGQALAGDGSPAYQARIFRALRGSVWVVLVGVLFLLDSFNVLSWGRSWPLFIIVGGVMALLERSTSNTVAAMPYGYPAPGYGNPGAVPPQAVTPDLSAAGMAIVTPLQQHEDEGGDRG